jgi:hypothetical protein
MARAMTCFKRFRSPSRRGPMPEPVVSEVATDIYRISVFVPGSTCSSTISS